LLMKCWCCCMLVRGMAGATPSRPHAHIGNAEQSNAGGFGLLMSTTTANWYGLPICERITLRTSSILAMPLASHPEWWFRRQPPPNLVALTLQLGLLCCRRGRKWWSWRANLCGLVGELRHAFALATHRLRDLGFRITLGHRLAFVALGLAFAQREFDFGPAIFEVNRQRHQRESLHVHAMT
jgi:hypothetical protein